MPRSFIAVFTAIVVLVLGLLPEPATSAHYADPRANRATPAVISLSVIGAPRAASVLQSLYPNARVSVDRSANALIVVAPPEDVSVMRSVISGIDVKSPTMPSVDAEQLHNVAPEAAASKLRVIFPDDRFTTGPNRTLIAYATPADIAEIRTLVGTFDASTATPSPTYAPAEAVRLTQGNPRVVARAVAASVPGVRIAVSGSNILLRGAQEQMDRAKALIAELDEPNAGTQYTQVYRLRYVDAQSVADLLRRSFPHVDIEVDKDLNALSVLAPASAQKRIAAGIAQLDAGSAPSQPATTGGGLPVGQPGEMLGAPGSGAVVVTLKAAVPGLNGAPSSSASDIATTVTQALASEAPDLKITVPPNSTQLVLTGSTYSIELAKHLIDQLDVAQPLVVLDTEVLEVDEADARNLGLQLQQPVISTTFTEVQPTPNPTTGIAPPLMSLGSFGRTQLSLGVELNLLVQSGHARVLSDPRITTVSGRTASIRAGDTLAILTTAGGGSGTVATTQLQTFQTGVSLDITPVVNVGNFITVTLHPTVNNLSGILNGVPQISTRDTTTTVGLQSDQTLVIGGLIEDSTNRTESKIPVAGDLPLVGKLFRSNSINRQRNELVITVTPHIVQPDAPDVMPGPVLPSPPAPLALPTLSPGTEFPSPVLTSEPVPHASAIPVRRAAPETPSPAPTSTPKAFGESNTFVYGLPPRNNYAGGSDPVQIYYVKLSPTVLKNGSPVHIEAITSSNVLRLAFGYGSYLTDLKQTAPGQWVADYSFTTTGIPFSSGANTQLMLRAARTDGQSASLPVPVTIVR